MRAGTSGNDRLDSWKEIASYINRSVRTVIRWEARKGMPVHRIPGGERQAVFAYRSEIDAWMKQGGAGREAEARGGMLAADRNEASDLSLHAADEPGHPSRRADSSHRFRPAWWWAAVILIGATVSAYAVLRVTSPERIRLTEETQLTDDGTLKMGLATDGRTLYFGEWKGGRIVLAAVPVTGGPVREIPTPFIQTQPLGVSSDGRKILAMVGAGQEEERELWMVPANGGAPQRVGSVLCHFAALSPDGKAIAYSRGDSIYLTEDAGRTSQIVESFAMTPQELRWSLDGQKILFRLWNRSSGTSALWELALGPAPARAVTSLVPLSSTLDSVTSLSPVIDAAGDAFVSTEGAGAGLFALEHERVTFRDASVLSRLTRNPVMTADLAADPRSPTLYFRRDDHGQHELEWFDTRSRQFKPFLAGVSVRDVDFSRDGRRLAYVREPDRSLWVANADGSSARRIETPDIAGVELPRWSPDGRQLAFMGVRPHMPFRIFVVAPGGPVREASRGTDNQGAPTWSPDGRRIVYGRVRCEEEDDCSIQQIDVANATQTMLPGSEGLTTARWSPDGRYVAALRPETQEVYLLNMRTRVWKSIAHNIDGNDLAWSMDSQFLYASNPSSKRPQVMRIPLHGGKMTAAVDLSDFSKLSGRVDTWFTVTPDNSILFVRMVDRDEIYAVHYAER